VSSRSMCNHSRRPSFCTVFTLRGTDPFLGPPVSSFMTGWSPSPRANNISNPIPKNRQKPSCKNSSLYQKKRQGTAQPPLILRCDGVKLGIRPKFGQSRIETYYVNSREFMPHPP